MRNIIRLVQPTVMILALMGSMVTPSRSQVDLKVGGGIGIMSPISDLSGSTLSYYAGSNYGLNTGLNIHGKGKLGLSGLNLVAEIDYSSLSNTGNSEPGQGSVDISQRILSLKVGPEFQISLPGLPFTPYIGAHLAMNNFSGETRFQGVSKVPSATYNVKSATRLGAGFSAGTEIGIGPLLSLDIGIAYNLMNISGKEWYDANPGADQRLDSYLSLNDGVDPQYVAGDDKHFISNARSIHSMLFTVSILFGL